uniref:Uncharacterized protein n=1 Tax=Chromera velia CCMP2878 TaxID=1169474 RepID=A0A0G4H7J7_9ALVE|eukprot:Cvel_25040.t1-p1 / transcript=Cvel_25040.t1 / gene=Cvel_25040 / organism=Chromera_velia_CCMP2878 / gene_product=hypothetical protein / transcript_product=hypothetical protein / location=Cvel_scaffold2782:4786-14849(+) / protein_length=561 / sequence_SO=supercontig / SO=protein_coding / is_pseudo=false
MVWSPWVRGFYLGSTVGFVMDRFIQHLYAAGRGVGGRVSGKRNASGRGYAHRFYSTLSANNGRHGLFVVTPLVVVAGSQMELRDVEMACIRSYMPKWNTVGVRRRVKGDFSWRFKSDCMDREVTGGVGGDGALRRLERLASRRRGVSICSDKLSEFLAVRRRITVAMKDVEAYDAFEDETVVGLNGHFPGGPCIKKVADLEGAPMPTGCEASDGNFVSKQTGGRGETDEEGGEMGRGEEGDDGEEEMDTDYDADDEDRWKVTPKQTGTAGKKGCDQGGGEGEKQKTKRGWWILFSVLFVLVLLGGSLAALFYFRPRSFEGIIRYAGGRLGFRVSSSSPDPSDSPDNGGSPSGKEKKTAKGEQEYGGLHSNSSSPLTSGTGTDQSSVSVSVTRVGPGKSKTKTFKNAKRESVSRMPLLPTVREESQVTKTDAAPDVSHLQSQQAQKSGLPVLTVTASTPSATSSAGGGGVGGGRLDAPAAGRAPPRVSEVAEQEEGLLPTHFDSWTRIRIGDREQLQPKTLEEKKRLAKLSVRSEGLNPLRPSLVSSQGSQEDLMSNTIKKK